MSSNEIEKTQASLKFVSPVSFVYFETKMLLGKRNKLGISEKMIPVYEI